LRGNPPRWVLFGWVFGGRWLPGDDSGFFHRRKFFLCLLFPPPARGADSCWGAGGGWGTGSPGAGRGGRKHGVGGGGPGQHPELSFFWGLLERNGALGGEGGNRVRGRGEGSGPTGCSSGFLRGGRGGGGEVRACDLFSGKRAPPVSLFRASPAGRVPQTSKGKKTGFPPTRTLRPAFRFEGGHERRSGGKRGAPEGGQGQFGHNFQGGRSRGPVFSAGGGALSFFGRRWVV